jgi:hypothetical protein
MRTKAAIKEELEALVKEGKAVFLQEYAKLYPAQAKKLKLENIEKGQINQKYQNWYTRCLGLMRSLRPERAAEFVACYEPDPKRKSVDWETYSIKDYLLGMVVTRGYQKEKVFEPFGSFQAKMQHQLNIVIALLETIDNRIVNARTIIQADLFDTELETAEAESKAIKLPKKNPTIADFNEALKGSDTIDIPTWRHIQRLADIRNLSVHSKERDPTKEEMQNLIIGVRKYIAELM